MGYNNITGAFYYCLKCKNRINGVIPEDGICNSCKKANSEGDKR